MNKLRILYGTGNETYTNHYFENNNFTYKAYLKSRA